MLGILYDAINLIQYNMHGTPKMPLSFWIHYNFISFPLKCNNKCLVWLFMTSSHAATMPRSRNSSSESSRERCMSSWLRWLWRRFLEAPKSLNKKFLRKLSLRRLYLGFWSTMLTQNSSQLCLDMSIFLSETLKNT